MQASNENVVAILCRFFMVTVKSVGKQRPWMVHQNMCATCGYYYILEGSFFRALICKLSAAQFYDLGI